MGHQKHCFERMAFTELIEQRFAALCRHTIRKRRVSAEVVASALIILGLQGEAFASGSALVTITPANQSFGIIPVGTPSVMTLQANNSSSSNSSIQICAIAAGGPFLIVDPPSLPSAEIAPGHSLAFQVEYFPTSSVTSFAGVAVNYGVSTCPSNGPANGVAYGVVEGVGLANNSLVITTPPILPSVPPGFAPSLGYSETLTASGGVGTLQWSLAQGSILPEGLSLNAVTGAITGSVSSLAAGSYAFTVQVSDSTGATATESFTLPVVAPYTGSVAECNNTPWNVPGSQAPLVSLTDLGTGQYCPNGTNCYEGGLYPNGSNFRPNTNNYAGNGISLAGTVIPIYDNSNPPKNPAVVAISVGFSNPSLEFTAFSALEAVDTSRNPYLQVVDGAEGSEAACCLSGSCTLKQCDASYWTVHVPGALQAAGVTANQVEAVWLKGTNFSPIGGFPSYSQALECDLETVITGMVQAGCTNTNPQPGLLSHFPNLKLVYLSSRTYAGYSNDDDNPETYSYETGFADQWLVSAYINETLQGPAPFVSWGPYLWSNGLTPRSDGLVWTCADVKSTDGRHPSSPYGQTKVASMLLNFFKTDATTAPWFNAAPAPGVSPLSLSYGNQVLGSSSAQQTVTLTNTGGTNLTISAVTIRPDYSETSTCGSSVAPGATCSFTVTFTPTTTGTLDESLTITDNGAGSPQVISLTGTGTEVELLPNTLSFGPQPLGTTSPPQTVTLTNVGKADLSITGVNFSKPDGGDFAQTNDCPTVIGPRASCTINVTFTPKARGLRTSSITIVDNGGGSPQKVGISGTGQ